MALLWTGSGDVLEICSDDDSAETSIPVGSFGMISDICGMSIGNTSKKKCYTTTVALQVKYGSHRLTLG